MDAGHYICYGVRQVKNQKHWIKLDDARGEQVGATEVNRFLSGEHVDGFRPYLLLYEEVDVASKVAFELSKLN